jgi:hypothetical protein
LLLLLPIWRWGPHLSPVMNQVKLIEEAHEWVPAVWKMVFSWYVWIIFHVLNSGKGSCCNAHHCFAAACSYLTLGPSFDTSDELSQTDWRSTQMGTCSVSNGIACMYGLYPMSWIQNMVVATMPTTVLLLLVPIWHWGHHLSLVMYIANGIQLGGKSPI